MMASTPTPTSPSMDHDTNASASPVAPVLSMPVAPLSLTIQSSGDHATTPIGLHVHASPNHHTNSNGSNLDRPLAIAVLSASSASTAVLSAPLSPPLSQPGSASSRRRAWASSTTPAMANASSRAVVAPSSQLAINQPHLQLQSPQPHAGVSSARRNSTISIAIVTPQFAWNGRCGKRWICNTTTDGGFRYLVLAGATCVCFLSGLSYVTSLYLVPFQDQFHVGRSVAALSSTLNFFFFALMCTFAGRLADYYGVKKVLSCGLLCVIIGLLGTSFANGLPMVCIFFGAFLGAGLATAYMSALTVQPEWFPKRSGLAYGVTLAGSGLGNFVFAWAAQGSMDAYGWRTSLIVLAAMFATLAVVAVILVQKKTVSIQENHRRITRAITQLQLSAALSVPDSPGLASTTATVGSSRDGALWSAASARERATSSARAMNGDTVPTYHRPSITGSGGAMTQQQPIPQSSPLSVPSRTAPAVTPSLDLSQPAVATVPLMNGVRASTSSNEMAHETNANGPQLHHAPSEEKVASLSVPSPASSDLSSSSSSLVPSSSSSSSCNIASMTVRSPPSSIASPSTGTATGVVMAPITTSNSHPNIQIATVTTPSHGNNGDSFATSGIISPIGSIGSLEFISPLSSARVHPDPLGSPSLNTTATNGGNGVNGNVPSSHRVMVLAVPNKDTNTNNNKVVDKNDDMFQSPRSLLSETQQLTARKGSIPMIEAPPPLPPLLDWKLLKSPPMIWFMFSQAFVTFPYYAPYVHLVPYADDLHLPTSQSSSLLMIISIGSLTGRLLAGAACDRVGALRCYRFCCSIMILCCSLWIACTGIISLAFLAAGFGISAGGVVASTTASCPPLVGKERASSALGLLYGIAWLPGSLATGYLMGWCKDQTGSYAAATYTLAGMALISILTSIMAERVSNVKSNTDDIIAGVDGATAGDNTNAIIINTAIAEEGNHGNGNGDAPQLTITIPAQSQQPQIVVDATA